MGEKIRIVIADDSAIIRGLLEKAFLAQGKFEILDNVSNGRKAVDAAKEKRPDLVVSDLGMPELDGIEATKIISGEYRIPCVIFSEDPAKKEEALRAGAALFEVKPALSAFKMETIKAFADKVYLTFNSAKPRQDNSEGERYERSFKEFKILCIGASTGGPSATQQVLSGLGKKFPLPILYTQHLDVGADAKMAAWFDDSCPDIKVKLAENGEEGMPGTVYLAPADRHLEIDYINPLGRPVLKLSDDPPERFLRPAVNKLFRSAAKHYKNACLAVLLTGMGRDGAEGCKMIVDNGGTTIAEDRTTCTVFGMPAAAIEIGGASEVLPRDKIAARILELTDKEKS